ncbi:phosphoglucosamine mutase [Alloscardovia macacae]|uniref:Phosphoglucosamine mutase n=1 Tax=Alloscardovia macacae TaxID=1160091 RepID=A0A261F555_9BIFI|nr:phosphoglucosamine mutase [Alloscardovia macacae]OZG54241.1 phosphoglucosamine mutase [Alloscardovia macacae]
MPRLFGTDGVRGLANGLLTADLALKMGDAAVRVFGDDEHDAQGGQGSHDGTKGRQRALIGRDTRVSGDFLASALAAGMSAGGFDVIDVGILPTPGVAFLTSVLNVEMGAVISASHNAMPDNGIKFFARGGFKLPDAKEDEIEEILGTEWKRPTGAGVGRVSHDNVTASNLYIDHLVQSIAPSGERPLKGLRIVVDCANGATSAVAPEALRRAGADVVVINASPDGYNINDHAGSTHPEQLQAMVKASDAVMGVAFDGDADRCIAVDEDGTLVNGDQIMGILARAYQREGKLKDNTLVITVMSNLGLILALKKMGIQTVQTAVGDRYVLEKMLEGGYTLGGEQSGHVINRQFATTGDGTLTALCLANEVMKSGHSLKELAADFPQLPQQLVNVPNVDKMAAATNEAVQAAVRAEEELLGETGRVLLRPSGTEPLVRVMAEAATQEQADAVCARLADVVARELAL